MSSVLAPYEGRSLGYVVEREPRKRAEREADAYRELMGEEAFARQTSEAARFSPVPRLVEDKRHPGMWFQKGFLRWDEVVQLPVPGSVAAEPPKSKQLRLATEVLMAQLAGGARPAVEVFEAAERAGVSPRTVKRAKKLLGVRASRRGFGRGSVVYWEPPPPAWTWVDSAAHFRRLRAERKG